MRDAPRNRKQKRSRSRPRLSCSVSFRLTEADYTRLFRDAAAANLRVNELARLRTLRSERSMINISHHRRADPALIAQLIAIGNNLNQLVKRLHITGRVSPHLQSLCRKLESIIDAAMQEGGD